MTEQKVKANEDTVKLLKECSAGVRMGIDSIDEVMPHTKDAQLRELLDRCRREHAALFSETEKMLADIGEEGKEPNAMAKGMSRVKTNFKIATDASDATVADLMTDGCNMGVKSLWRYRNQYKNADDATIALAGRLIDSEENLVADLRKFL